MMRKGLTEDAPTVPEDVHTGQGAEERVEGQQQSRGGQGASAGSPLTWMPRWDSSAQEDGTSPTQAAV